MILIQNQFYRLYSTFFYVRIPLGFVKIKESLMEQLEITRLQNYLRHKFGTDRIRLKARKEDTGSVEVLMVDEYIGLIYRDEEEGEVSYDFNMGILEMDVKSIEV